MMPKSRNGQVQRPSRYSIYVHGENSSSVGHVLNEVFLGEKGRHAPAGRISAAINTSIRRTLKVLIGRLCQFAFVKATCKFGSLSHLLSG